METNHSTEIPNPLIMVLPVTEEGVVKLINLSHVTQAFYRPDGNTIYIEFVNENHENLAGANAHAVYQEMVKLAARFESIRG